MPLERIREDMTALGAIGHRYAGTDGERQMLAALKARLPPEVPARSDGFVAFTSPAAVVVAHAAGLLVFGVLGLFFPLVAAIGCALMTLSLSAEALGRLSLLRWVLPKDASYNLVLPPERVLEGHDPTDTLPPEGFAAATAEASRPAARGTVVVCASLDVPRWRPDTPRWLRRPIQFVLVAAAVVTGQLLARATAEPWGMSSQGIYGTSLAVLAAAVLLGVVAHRRTSDAHQDASGPAAVLELVRRMRAEPVDGVDFWAVFTGCGHAYQNGMSAFLAMRGKRFQAPVLVIALDEPGRTPLQAVVSEGPLYAQHHRPTGPALVERLRWSGLEIPSVDYGGVTDARAALLRGFRAVGFAGGKGPSTPEGVAHCVDVVEAVVRLYGEDLARVGQIVPRSHVRAVAP